MSSRATVSTESARLLGERNGLRLAVSARPRRDLGALIREPNSPDLVAGVRIEDRKSVV